jgi:uncharacterized radical SAM superfamily Fe-S cluster-containing enzyme
MQSHFPRIIESLCPGCNSEAVALAIASGDSSVLKNSPGVIRAEILERDGTVVMRKACPKHGAFEDLLASDAKFFERMEERATGVTANGGSGHDHGVLSVREGTGGFIVIDLTTRCNLKCARCFMDANGIGYVHEPEFETIRQLLDRAYTARQKAEVNILFSGGEPTLSPNLLRAVRYAKSLGFKRLYMATNGIRLGQEQGFAQACRAAGLHGIFLQFDGIGNPAHSYLGATNLFDVKVEALNQAAEAGLQIVLQVTVTNGVNSDQVGPILDFAISNIDRVFGVLFQPIMFTGRDRDISDDDRHSRRYTLADLAADLRIQTDGALEPLRDWWPGSQFQFFAHLGNLLRRDDTLSIGQGDPGYFGTFAPLVVNMKSREWTPLGRFFDLDRFAKEIGAISANRRPDLARVIQIARDSFAANLAPSGFTFGDLPSLLEQCMSRANSGWGDWERRAYEDGTWRLIIIHGMWFQDLFNFDIRYNNSAPVVVATQEGEISFAAYNGAGWRQVVEHKFQTTSLAEWNRTQGRHSIYANQVAVPTEALTVIRK